MSLPLPPNYDSKCDLSFSTTPYTIETTATTNVENVVDTPPRRSTRSRRPPTYLEDFQTDLPAIHNVSSNYPLRNYVSYHALSPGFKHMILSISSHMEPRNYNEASQQTYWQLAMKSELDALDANQTNYFPSTW